MPSLEDADTYLVNGVDLRSHAWWLEVAEGLADAPEPRGDDLEIPGMHGALDPHAADTAARRRYGPGTITFRMGVKGVDPDTGAVPDDTLAEYFTHLDGLQRLFNTRRVELVHPRGDGDRRATARLAAPIRAVREPSSPWFGRFTAQLTIPAAFWTGPGDVTASATVATGGVLNLAGFAGGNAPITDAIIDFGPGNNPTLIQGGTYVAYDGVITAGRRLVIDCGDWSAGYGSGAVWSPDQGAIGYNPGPSWFELDPTAGDPPAAVLTHTGGGTMNVMLTAPPTYLTS